MTKTIGLLLLMATSLSTFADTAEINVEDYLSTDMEFIFEIQNHAYSKVILDCQGFINNVNIQYTDGSSQLMVLDIGECEDIHSQIVTGLEKESGACLKLDFDRRAYRVDSTCD